MFIRNRSSSDFHTAIMTPNPNPHQKTPERSSSESDLTAHSTDYLSSWDDSDSDDTSTYDSDNDCPDTKEDALDETVTPTPKSFTEKVAENAHGFREEDLQQFAALTADDRAAMLLMALQLSGQTTADNDTTTDWADYAARLAAAYDVAMFDEYRVLVHRALSTLHTLQRLPPPAPLTPAAAADADSLGNWVKVHIVDALGGSSSSATTTGVLAAGGAATTAGVVSQPALDCAAREHALVAFMWDDERFAGGLRRARCGVPVALFRTFTRTPRYVFVSLLRRIGALVAARIADSVPAPLRAKFDAARGAATTVPALNTWLEFFETHANDISAEPKLRAARHRHHHYHAHRRLVRAPTCMSN